MLISTDALELNMQMVNTASIQGMSDGELTPEHMVSYGKAAGMQYNVIAVGRDLTPSSMMMMNSFIAGARSVGSDILDIGVIPPMVMPFCKENQRCNVIFGNPEDRGRVGGITFYNTDGRLFTASQMEQIDRQIQTMKSVTNEHNIGNYDVISGTLEDYRRSIVNDSDDVDCEISIDCASGPCSLIAPSILTDLGADVTTLNCQMDGRSPGRELPPDEINLRLLMKSAKINTDGIGVAFNGDGTRIAAIDEGSRYISGSNLLAIMMRYLKPKTVVVPINTPMVVSDLLKCNVIYSPLSKQSLAEMTKDKEADIGGSDDGTFIFPSTSYCSDGIMAAITLGKIASESMICDMVDEIPKYYSAKGFVRHYESKEHLSKKLSDNLYSLEYDKISDCDGWRVEFNDGWLLVRFSDYDRAVDILAEGRDKAYTVSLLEMGKEIVSSSLMTIGR